MLGLVRSRARRLVVVSGLLAVLPVRADGPMVHEYFEPSPEEDLLLEATSPGGVLPAVIQTPSGVVRAPDARRAVERAERTYGPGPRGRAAEAVYRVDRDTSRPRSVSYDDPFNPSIVPYKRLYAFDAVGPSFELVVADPGLVRLPVGGAARPGEDRFYGDLVVDLVPGQPVRIPGVAPGARVLGYETFPRTELVFLADSAENWFVRGEQRARIRLVLELGADRAVFGGELADVPAEAMPAVPPLPEAVAAAGRDLLEQLELGPDTRPRVALEVLVRYFRTFAPSNELPRATGGAELYQEIARSRKGVCRHRAYAFVITALAQGIPARFVSNEAHAWVEAHDGRRWRRIDLGGAAADLDVTVARDTFEHAPPPDPFPWPAGGEQTTASIRRSPILAGPSGGSRAEPSAPASSVLVSRSGDSPAEPAFGPVSPTLPPSTIILEQSARTVLRGAPLEVAGRVEADGVPCAGLRVDVALGRPRQPEMVLGSLPTHADGTFRGSVVVPPETELGDYQLLLSTPGHTSCGPGRFR